MNNFLKQILPIYLTGTFILHCSISNTLIDFLVIGTGEGGVYRVVEIRFLCSYFLISSFIAATLSQHTHEGHM